MPKIKPKKNNAVALKIISMDKRVFMTDSHVMRCSKAITTLLENCPHRPDEIVEIPLDILKGTLVDKIIKWATFHSNDKTPPQITSPHLATNESSYRMSGWDWEFFDVEQKELFMIMRAADYLGMDELLVNGSIKVGSLMENKTPNQIRNTFNIT